MPNPAIARIIAATLAEFTEVRPNEFRSHRHAPIFCLARHVAYYIARHDTDLTFQTIGDAFDRDPTTIRHGSEVIATLIGLGDPITARIAAIRSALA